MHSMTELCTNRRQAKRLETAHRLQACAVQLTLQHGFDHWTMDDLASAADVSRRTVFNYFAGKAEVILGPEPEIDNELRDLFVAGGPSGRLVDDILALARTTVEEKGHHEHDLTAIREAVMSDPRLLALVHERFEMAAGLLGDAIRLREGADFPDDRVRLLLRLLMTVFDHSLERASQDPGKTFGEHFDTTVADARSALA